ncbi:DNA primase [Taylorella equigenitalis]|uniref:DNA primase n=1 Tax=Taylorella equigenitalis TaxID=29575 RepID=UPI000404C050|nr:DNA primase [Taylorella equigenitalis]WDU47294.1 DNA primase [Taylorella equigenitalis]WED99822.1 DNA primase [Taylorella equigenitalis]WEE01300.1 DNA primase [Taylorella equigenitalis]WFD77837.1 DNA primase [Taylorella equigenitalis]WFD79315.1 DNA primase [Taylorella equigenitalis]
MSDSFTNELLSRTNIVDIIGGYLTLRKSGASYIGLCPFHNEKRPSFSVNSAKQIYKCFSCGESGNVITFLMKYNGMTFPEACKYLADKLGLEMPKRHRLTEREQQELKNKKSRQELMCNCLLQAQEYYVFNLQDSQEAKTYIAKRELNEDSIKKFSLGWSGSEYKNLAHKFPDYDDKLLMDVGLVLQNEELRKRDRFRNRLMFPILNENGKTIGFGGRTLNNDQPKYLNSPETEVFHKGKELYGLFENKKGIIKEKKALVVEGYMDVIALSQHGFDYAVATLGTATSQTHIQKLYRYTSTIIFCFDGDTAGREAAWKALNECLPILKEGHSIRFLFLPPEHDPDSYVRAYGGTQFKNQIKSSKPLSIYLLDELKTRFNLNEAEGRAGCYSFVKPLIATIPKSAIKTQMEKEVSKLLNLTHEEFLADLGLSDTDFKKADRPYKKTKIKKSTRTSKVSVEPLEYKFIKLLAMYPYLTQKLSARHIEILKKFPKYRLVHEFINLIYKHQISVYSQLLNQVDIDVDLLQILDSIESSPLNLDEVESPEEVLKDTLQRVELDSIQTEMSEIAQREDLEHSQKESMLQRLNRRYIALRNH